MTKLTKNFTLEEFLVSSHWTQEQIRKFLTDEIIENIFLLALELQKIRDALNLPLVITSGFRPPELNQIIGGSPNSLHIKGKACDFTIKYPNPSHLFHTIAQMIENAKLNIGEFIIYLNKDLSFSRFHLATPNFKPFKLNTLLLSIEGTKAYTPITLNFLKNFDEEIKKFKKL